MNKSDLINFIKKNPVFSLATCLNNIPYVRKMLIIKVDENNIIFNVKKYKPLYEQLKSNPNVQLCFYNKSSGEQIRLSGKVKEFNDQKLVNEILEKHPDLEKQIVKYGNDVIRLFVLKNWETTYWNNKNKEQTIKLL